VAIPAPRAPYIKSQGEQFSELFFEKSQKPKAPARTAAHKKINSFPIISSAPLLLSH